jgi:hypothetical protein
VVIVSHSDLIGSTNRAPATGTRSPRSVPGVLPDRPRRPSASGRRSGSSPPTPTHARPDFTDHSGRPLTLLDRYPFDTLPDMTPSGARRRPRPAVSVPDIGAPSYESDTRGRGPRKTPRLAIHGYTRSSKSAEKLESGRFPVSWHRPETLTPTNSRPQLSAVRPTIRFRSKSDHPRRSGSLHTAQPTASFIRDPLLTLGPYVREGVDSRLRESAVDGSGERRRTVTAVNTAMASAVTDRTPRVQASFRHHRPASGSRPVWWRRSRGWPCCK